MPLYDYRCDTCGDFEAWRKLADLETPITCPACDSTVRRLFSPPNINLNSGSFPMGKPSKQPRVVKQAAREPSPSRVQSSPGGRPWMISHTPERL